jgi:uncharacterized membrane protein YdbT with pleckstrin-like domain
MQCPKCQTEVVPQASFCYSCGARLSPEAEDDAGNSPGNPLSSRSSPAADRNEPEQELWRGTYSPKAALPTFVVAGVISLVVVIAVAAFATLSWVHWLWLLVAIALVFGGIAANLWITRLSTAYRLTTQRLVHETGLLRRVTNRLEVIDIDDVTTVQGLIDRILQIGTIKLTSSDRTHPVLQLRGVGDARTVADLIDNARRRERMRRGLHIEAI